MLLRTLFLLGCIAVLGSVIVQASGALARASVHRAATLATDRVATDALTLLEQTIASAIAGGADPRTATLTPITTPDSCALAGASGTCLLLAHATVRSVVVAPIANQDQPAAPCDARCAINLQENDAVAEGRLAALISATAFGPSGTILAQRDRYVSLRTLRAPPFVTIAGSRDATNDRFDASSAQGDDSGGGGTIVSVKYRNANSGAEMDGNAWQSRPWSSNDAPVGWSP